jgi:WhiB family redox-sensing transcriptional regulator
MFDESNEGIWYAKAVCEACPLTVKCLNKALDTRERWGVWGGLSTDERERLRKERR